MPKLEEARKQQAEAQRKGLMLFFGALVFLAAVCIALYFLADRAAYIGIVVSFFAMYFVSKKSNIAELLRPREFVGEVSYFSVHIERVKSNYSNSAGARYGASEYTLADIAVTDKNGKTLYKTFVHSAEYDRVKNGDKATLLRFVDRPIIEPEDEK